MGVGTIVVGVIGLSVRGTILDLEGRPIAAGSENPCSSGWIVEASITTLFATRRRPRID